jgi:hypothetical protein
VESVKTDLVEVTSGKLKLESKIASVIVHALAHRDLRPLAYLQARNVRVKMGCK